MDEILDKEDILNFSDGFDCKEEASEHYDEILEKLNNFDQKINLYRLVFLKDLSDLDFNNLGSHWSEDLDVLFDIKDYLKDECSGEVIEGETYLIEATFNKKDVVFMSTLVANLTNPEEEEIFIKENALFGKETIISTVESEKYKNINLLEYMKKNKELQNDGLNMA